MEIRELKKRFDGKGEVKGYVFTQIRASETAYIYEVEANGQIHYETFKRRVRSHPNMETDYVPYPNSRAFGYWAWTTNTLEKAENRFNNLKQEE